MYYFRFVPREKMNQKCDPIVREECGMTMKTECQNLCKEKCENTDKKVCMTIPHQECQEKPIENCQDTPKTTCRKVNFTFKAKLSHSFAFSRNILCVMFHIIICHLEFCKRNVIVHNLASTFINMIWGIYCVTIFHKELNVIGTLL